MPVLDLNNSNLTAELEVKKLQELVRKLERQNEQLRSRSSGGSARKHMLPTSPGSRLSSPVSAGFCESETFEYFRAHTDGDGTAPGEAEDISEPSVLDELELLDLKPLSCSDESDETWLYRSRAGPSDSVTPLQWCRQVLDRPRLEVEPTRRSLSLRLEQGARWCSSPLSPSLSPTLYRVLGVSPLCTSCSTPHPSEQHAPPLCSPLHPTLHRILSPVRKELLPPLAERTPSFLPHSPSRGVRRSLISSQSSLDGRLGSSDLDKDFVLGYSLQDLTDVQVMARLQEESLRQDLVMTSSVLSGHRSRSLGFQISSVSGSSNLEEEDGEDDKGLLPLPSLQPRLLTTRLPHSQAFNSIRHWKQSSPSSTHSIPSRPLSPSSGPASQDPGPGPRMKTGLGSGPGPGSFCAGERQDLRPGSDALRRSMQNLVRTPNVPSVPSASLALLRNSHSFDSSSGLPRLQSSSPQLSRVHSVGSFTSLSWQPLKATAYVSPTIKGSVSTAPSTPRSGLPLPGSTPCSKVAQSARSLTTSQRSWWSLSAPRDVSWRVGCYGSRQRDMRSKLKCPS